MVLDASALTEDAILGGRLRLLQPERGHRVGHDAILLAASTPARAGDRVVELGAGVGAAALALATRVADIRLTLVEIDPALAALAAENARRNGLAGQVETAVLDVAGSAHAYLGAGLPPESAARVMMNPPFNDAARHRMSTHGGRRLAHVASGKDALQIWIKAAASLLQPRGTLTLIWRADGLATVLHALDPRFGAIAVLPVHPKAGEPAIRVLVRATKASHGPLVLCPGLVLNDQSGRPTAEAEAVLRQSSSLPLAEL